MATATSFIRRAKVKVRHIPGTKLSLYNNQLLISTGVPSLDVILGGGIAVGTVFLVEEDTFARYSQLLVKYFCAEGVVCGHNLSLISLDQDPHHIARNLPAPTQASSQEKGRCGSTDQPATGDDKMSIAWRYQNQPKVQSTLTSQFGHYYNLANRMDEETIKHSNIQCFGFNDIILCPDNLPENQKAVPKCPYQCSINVLRNRISGKYDTATKREDQEILRIAIQGLGSGLWGDTRNSSDARLPQFLVALRALLRTAYAVCLVTVSTQDFQELGFIKRLEHLSDTVVRLDGFATEVKKKYPVYQEYSGLFHLVKLPCLNELVPHMPDTLDLAFRVRRKKFTIEKLNLPPELSDAASRKQKDLVPITHSHSGCSLLVSSDALKLDF